MSVYSIKNEIKADFKIEVTSWIDIDEQIVKDMPWLRPKNDGVHINIVDLDFLFKGLNITLKWQRQIISIRCDSVSVCKWVESFISGDKRI